MNFTIPRRWHSTLSQITVEIDARYENVSNGVQLGAAVKIVIGQARKDDTRAVLTGAILTRAILTRANLTDADLTDADLTDANLTGAILTRANLTGANLTGANLRDAVIPIVPNIDAAILASIEANKAAGTNGLQMNGWHGADCDETNWCETTHCRAGYAICLAGSAGFALERKIGAAAAGALIYSASRPGERVPNFYASDEDAMADIQACAARQMAAIEAEKTTGEEAAK